MGWKGVRRDIINAGKRAATASRKDAERAERARLKAIRSAPPQPHYPMVSQGYGPPPGQGYGQAPQGYAPHGYGPPPGPTWTAPPQKSGLSAGLLLAMVFGSLFFCGTCTAVITSVSNRSTREDAPAAPARTVVTPAAPTTRTTAAAPVVVRPVQTPRPAAPAPRAPAPVAAPPSGPHCCDGSPARCTGRGCCSHHGGVCG
jgi:hypothetical protein